MRFVFSPPVEAAADLVTLPWDTPLSQWTDDRIVEIPQHGRSRHVVRFVAEPGRVFAVKELPEQPARREHEVLRRLQELGIPAVEVIGVVDRRGDQEAVLVTRFLDYSSSFLALFADPRGVQLIDRMMNAQVELLVRLNLAGIVWATVRWPTPCSGSTPGRWPPTSWTPRRARCTSDSPNTSGTTTRTSPMRGSSAN